MRSVAHVGMLRGRLVEQLAEERVGLEGIGLVDAGEPAGQPARLAALGQAERKLEQPLGGLARDHQGLARLVVRHHALAHRGEHAFGRLADHHEVDAALGRADDRGRDAGDEPARPHARIEVEDEAQFDLRHDLGVVGIAHAGQPAGAEQDGVGLLAQLDGATPASTCRCRDSAPRRPAPSVKRKFEPRRRRRDLAQDLQRRRHHLGPDAVAREDRDVERVIGEHEKVSGAAPDASQPE